jgi:DNA-binding response OmpR family regulator
MPSGLVLVIEDDEWVSRLLSGAIREAGYNVVACSAAKAGLETACAVEPDCIICDIDLPDEDGYWVARSVRTQASRVAVTPFLFLSALDDHESRLEGFHVGADVYMTKPFRVDEVVAQVGALVQMAARLRRRRDSFLSSPSSDGAAIEGDLDQMSIATVLTVLEMERRSGVFEVLSKKRRAQLDIAGGFIVSGAVGGTSVSALAALRTMLGWHVGRFSFAPSPGHEPPGPQKSIGAFLIEAVRLEDEAARTELDLPSPLHRASQPKLTPPTLGGPPSRPDDIAPPSQRQARSSSSGREAVEHCARSQPQRGDTPYPGAAVSSSAETHEGDEDLAPISVEPELVPAGTFLETTPATIDGASPSRPPPVSRAPAKPILSSAGTPFPPRPARPAPVLPPKPGSPKVGEEDKKS